MGEGGVEVGWGRGGREAWEGEGSGELGDVLVGNWDVGVGFGCVVEGGLVAGFDDLVEFEGWGVGIGRKAAWREHGHVCDRRGGGEVGERVAIAAFGDVPGVDSAVGMAGEEGGAVVAQGEAQSRKMFGCFPPI